MNCPELLTLMDRQLQVLQKLNEGKITYPLEREILETQIQILRELLLPKWEYRAWEATSDQP